MDGSPQKLSLRERRKAQVREQIVRAAFELFGRHGYENVSVEAICEAAGVSRATFFNYYPQRELILGEIAKARFEKLRDFFTSFGSSGEQPDVHDVVNLFLQFARENATVTGNSRRLIVQSVMTVAASGELAALRRQAIGLIAEAAGSRVMAETLFAIYLATTLEWLMDPAAPGKALAANMRARMELVVGRSQ